MSPAHSDCKPGTPNKNTGPGPLARGTRLVSNGPSETPSEIEQQILQAIEGIRFGSVSVVLQDGVVVQIEANERFRPMKKSS
jgi:hypothetical protein